jgi:hypothetical protein
VAAEVDALIGGRGDKRMPLSPDIDLGRAWVEDHVGETAHAQRIATFEEPRSMEQCVVKLTFDCASVSQSNFPFSPGRIAAGLELM